MNAKFLSSLAVLSLIAAPTIALAKSTTKAAPVAKVAKAPKKEKAHK